MAVVYTVLTKDEQDEILVQFMLAQERDHYCHTINHDRYQALLATLPVGSPFQVRIQGLDTETVDRLFEVESLINETTKQIQAQAVDIPATLARLEAKAKAAQTTVVIEPATTVTPITPVPVPVIP